MNNQEATEAIKSNYSTSGYEMLKEALNMAVNALEQQEKQRWHTVADGDLPKGDKIYTVTCECSGIVGEAYFSDGHWHYNDESGDFFLCEVIAWKELPEEYKPEERE